MYNKLLLDANILNYGVMQYKALRNMNHILALSIGVNDFV